MVSEKVLQDILKKLHSIEERLYTLEGIESVEVERTPDAVKVYRYVRPDDNMGGVTIAAILDYGNNTITYGVSLCYDENFSKSIGRTIADRQLDANPKVIECDLSEIGPLVNVIGHDLGITYSHHFENWIPAIRKAYAVKKAEKAEKVVSEQVKLVQTNTRIRGSGLDTWAEDLLAKYKF